MTKGDLVADRLPSGTLVFGSKLAKFINPSFGVAEENVGKELVINPEGIKSTAETLE